MSYALHDVCISYLLIVVVCGRFVHGRHTRVIASDNA